ncbi:MAG: hypothetical protein EBY39_08145, partial [Flavobacteriia bacterium]|nr:hypothetical protein [Flavobacteriia bacterium]
LNTNFIFNNETIKRAVERLDAQLSLTQGEVDTEETARQNADTQLQSQIDALETSSGLVDGAIPEYSSTEFISNDQNHHAAIGQLDSSLKTVSDNLSGEITNRQNADTQLQNNIDAETLARQNADTQLQNQINSNISDISDLQDEDTN